MTIDLPGADRLMPGGGPRARREAVGREYAGAGMAGARPARAAPAGLLEVNR